MGTRLTRLGRDTPSRRTRALFSVIGALLFIGVGIVSWISLPTDPTRANWMTLAIMGIVTTPLIVLLLAAEFLCTARIVGVRIEARSALRTSLVATAANLLPLPGSPIVRAVALQRRGASFSDAAGALAMTAGAWAAVASIMAGGAHLLWGQRTIGGAAVCGAGVIGLLLVGGGVHRRDRSNALGILTSLVFIEVAFILVSAARYFVVLSELGFDVRGDQGMALVLAGVLASLFGFFPGGFGARELIAGLLSPLVGLPASAGALAAALIRCIELIVLGPVALIAGKRR